MQNGRPRSVARYVLPTALQKGCSLSTAIPRTPGASGPHDPRQDSADNQKDSSEQDEGERVGPGPRAHRGTPVRRTTRRFRVGLSPRNARAGTHRIMQAGPLVWGGVREDHPHEEDGRHQQERQCLNDSHDQPSLDRVSVPSSVTVRVADALARGAEAEVLRGRTCRSGRSALNRPRRPTPRQAVRSGSRSPTSCQSPRRRSSRLRPRAAALTYRPSARYP